jgi:hypothetical protein
MAFGNWRLKSENSDCVACFSGGVEQHMGGSGSGTRHGRSDGENHASVEAKPALPVMKEKNR